MPTVRQYAKPTHSGIPLLPQPCHALLRAACVGAVEPSWMEDLTRSEGYHGSRLPSEVRCAALHCTAVRCDHSHSILRMPLTAQVTGVSLAAVTLLEPHLQVCFAVAVPTTHLLS